MAPILLLFVLLGLMAIQVTATANCPVKNCLPPSGVNAIFDQQICIRDDGSTLFGNTCEGSSNVDATVCASTAGAGRLRLFQIELLNDSYPVNTQVEINFTMVVQGFDEFRPVVSDVTCTGSSVNCFPYNDITNTSSISYITYSRVYWVAVKGRTDQECGNFSIQVTGIKPPPPPPPPPFEWNHVTTDPAIAVGLITGAGAFFFLRVDDPLVWLILACAVLASLGAGASVAGKPTVAPAGSYSLKEMVPMVSFFVSFTLAYVVVLSWKLTMNIINVLDVTGEKPKKVTLRGYQRRRSKIAVISWRWDIDNASQYEESKMLTSCFKRAAELGFDHVAVDVITLDQKSIDPRAVLSFAQSYRDLPVIVGVGSQEQLDVYRSRFWTNVEMKNYRNNTGVYMLKDELERPESMFTHINDVVRSDQVAATFDLDRLQVLLFSVPLASVIMDKPLRLIRKLEHEKIDVKFNKLQDCFTLVFACRTLLYASLRETECFGSDPSAGWCAWLIGLPVRMIHGICWAILMVLPPFTCGCDSPLGPAITMYWCFLLPFLFAGIAVCVAGKGIIVAVGLALISVACFVLVFGKIIVCAWAGRQICKELMEHKTPQRFDLVVASSEGDKTNAKVEDI